MTESGETNNKELLYSLSLVVKAVTTNDILVKMSVKPTLPF